MVHNNRHRYIYSVYISKETIQDYIGDGKMKLARTVLVEVAELRFG